MQANWSLVLNVVFLGVILSMIFWKIRPRFAKSVKSDELSHLNQSSVEQCDLNEMDDPCLGPIRKVNLESDDSDVEMHEEVLFASSIENDEITSIPDFDLNISATENDVSPEPIKRKNFMLFLSARGQNIFAGYELLQTLLACGLRYGEDGFFHRHQHSSGQGPVLFSVAAASTSGTFDLQNIGSMSMRGLCLFMELSGNVSIDQERLEIFVYTAKQLAEELHANLLDEHQKLVTSDTFSQFEKTVSMGEAVLV